MLDKKNHGKINSFVRVIINKTQRESAVDYRNNINPQWKDQWRFKIGKPVQDTERLKVKLYNKRTVLQDILIGAYETSLGEVFHEKDSQKFTDWFVLQNNKKVITGSIKISFQILDKKSAKKQLKMPKKKSKPYQK